MNEFLFSLPIGHDSIGRLAIERLDPNGGLDRFP